MLVLGHDDVGCDRLVSPAELFLLTLSLICSITLSLLIALFLVCKELLFELGVKLLEVRASLSARRASVTGGTSSTTTSWLNLNVL